MFVWLVPGLYAQLSGPRPGDIYREFILNLKSGDNWRVTDPDAGASGAQDFLPNPVMTIQISDLEGALRAEALMDIWGGHTGTTGKRFRFNGNDWIDLPDHPTIAESPECYNSEFNYITEIPLAHLKEGANEFEGTSGGQTCFNFNWGQWGWYVMLVRIYYGPEKPHPTGSISSHPSGSDIVEPDTILVEAQGAAGIKRVDLLGRYRGYDENGDGIYMDWHRNYHAHILEEHIGSATHAPYEIIWDNQWVPDQDTGSVSFMARILDSNNVWFVSEVVDSISLIRPEGVSVKMFTAENVPKKFWVRAGEKKSCDIYIQELTEATNARIIHRTWNGQDGGAGSGDIDKPLFVNDWQGKVHGANHNYALSMTKVAVGSLNVGRNEVAYKSTTVHHGIEILWPGPALLVRYNSNAAKVETPVISPPSGEYQMPVEVSIACQTPGASIYYTTDGTEPTVGSNRYLAPFQIDDDAIVRAMATKFDYLPSDTVRMDYRRFLFPRLVRAYKGPVDSTVVVEFSKPVEQTSAEDTANYSLDDGGKIIRATLDPEDSSRVILAVEEMVKGMEYTLSVNNVRDIHGMFIPFNSKAVFVYDYIVEITASDASEDHLPEHSMDGNFSTYWSALGTTGVWIQYDLRTMRLVQSVEIAFLFGDQRKSYFSIETSVDGMEWTEVYTGESSGGSLDLELFDFEDRQARYVRILGLGNSSTNDWNSYTEVQINWFAATGIPDRDSGTELKVFPQPAGDGIHVVLPGWQERTDMLFVNVMGQISRARLTGRSTWVPTRDLASGVYLIMVPFKERMLTKKILIINGN